MDDELRKEFKTLNRRFDVVDEHLEKIEGQITELAKLQRLESRVEKIAQSLREKLGVEV